MIKLVAFDLDGTIGDTIPLCIKAFKMAVKPYTQHELSEEDIIQAFGLDEEGMIKQIVPGNNWEAALNDFYTIYKKMHVLCPQPFDGIIELINELKNRHIPVALITGKGKISCDITLQQFGMEQFFDRIETGSAERNRKSEAIKHLLNNYNLHLNEMVYVGDAISDVVECKRVGITCLSAVWAASSMTINQLEQQNQGCVFYSVSSLRKFLTKNLSSTQHI
ncbi:phosphoglycolate phosphatase [Dysgonomonas sp. PFB1-18]|uniref:HAD family hydrolase n=1 Tax=unclassified Dysgonomonas TaxID=2630389 RepID=UPI002474C875|nr:MULTISPECIES: HAD hydrolase-like protein [unclassified Dysgonomonas]MDH6310997.1 phosphoglycolate phosphatase [Dysgonomonas sp. PF1-14]MDH6340788.1 phosphoglycolate phosphatase [Dysgonomonas sp. PF1-16]MDH6382425.1 phosphoglycolate phosphatase [Dysgonomonas sp. PFB1-18]MDH6399757.1 phosphoglycolate phosphatase [Dysgonomonas sp. PF1-23]